MKRIGVILILAFAFFGLADSAYLAQHEIAGTPLLCNIQNLSGCNVVAQSAYSHLFGIPLAVYGIIFYGIVFALAAFELVVYDQLLRRALQALALFGVLFSAGATLLQVFVIQALCVYCLTSAFLALLVFLIACFIEPLPMRARARVAAVPHATPEPEPKPFTMPPQG